MDLIDAFIIAYGFLVAFLMVSFVAYFCVFLYELQKSLRDGWRVRHRRKAFRIV